MHGAGRTPCHKFGARRIAGAAVDIEKPDDGGTGDESGSESEDESEDGGSDSDEDFDAGCAQAKKHVETYPSSDTYLTVTQGREKRVRKPTDLESEIRFWEAW